MKRQADNWARWVVVVPRVRRGKQRDGGDGDEATGMDVDVDGDGDRPAQMAQSRDCSHSTALDPCVRDSGGACACACAGLTDVRVSYGEAQGARAGDSWVSSVAWHANENGVGGVGWGTGGWMGGRWVMDGWRIAGAKGGWDGRVDG